MSGTGAHGAALALPALGAALAAQERQRLPALRLPEAQWLASRGARADEARTDWRAWLLDQYGPGAEILARCPSGVAIRAASTGIIPRGTWACAEPVHLLTELDRLRLAPRALLDLPDDEAHALAASLNSALEGSGFVLHATPRGCWSLECREPVECAATDPAVAEGQDIRELMPHGRDGARVRWLMNEFQVALHEHPVNLRRAARGAVTVNTLWPWGFGAYVPEAAQSLPSLYADDAWLRGIWQLAGARAHPFEEAPAGLADRVQAPVLLAATAVEHEPATGPARWESLGCAPVAAALRAGRIDEARLLLGDMPFLAPRSARHAVWRRRRSWPELLG